MSGVETPVADDASAEEAPLPRACPRCSAPVEPLQEYCLECGLRLPVGGTVAAEGLAEGEERPWTRTWLLPALLGLVIAAVGTGAAIAISDADDGPAAVSVATGGTRTATEPTPTLTAPEPTAPATTAAPPPATTAPPRTTTAPRRPATIAWPAGRRGWTIVLLSVPQANGRAGAEARAAEARRAGLQNVGILNSSRFASLHPGYFVVFTGVFESQAEATSALPRARSAFPLAYSRQVVP